MTDLIDRADSGEIPTEVIDLDGPTRNLTPYFRRPDATGERPLYDPAKTVQFALTAEDVTAIQGPQPPPPPIPPIPGPVIPPRHALTESVGEYPVVRPAVPAAAERLPRGRHRAGHTGAWWLLTGVGIVLLAEAVGLLAALVVSR